MSLKNVATEDWEYKFSEGDGSVEVQNQPSLKVKCGGKGAYFEKIKVKVSSFSISNVISGGSGEGEIKGSAQKLKIEGQPAVLEGDESEKFGVIGVDPAGHMITYYVTIKVQSAGQTKVKAE